MTMMSPLDQLNLNSIQDVEAARRAIVVLFNLVKDRPATVRQLQAENNVCAMR